MEDEDDVTDIKSSNVRCRGVDCPISRRVSCARHRDWWASEAITFDRLSHPADPSHCYQYVEVDRSPETCTCPTSGGWVMAVTDRGAVAHCRTCLRDATAQLESFAVASHDSEL